LATLPNPQPTTDAATEPGVAIFVADVPLNAVVRILGVGSFEIHGPVRGTELPAGAPFPVPAGRLADEFERTYSPHPDSANVSPDARAAGLIPGLRRIG
jgi:hypothetical protein